MTMSSRLVRRAPVHTDAAERLSTFLFHGRQYRKHDFRQQLGVQLFLGRVDRSGGAKNVVCSHAVALACKQITAVGTAKAFEDAAAHE